MPEKDVFHNAVKNALLKEGWIITHDPLFIQVGGIEMYVDIGAEKIIGAEKNGTKIAVEIKSFLSPSTIYEFHTALGQFMNYRLAIEEQRMDRILYLAVPVDTYKSFFMLPFIQSVIKRYQLNSIIYNVEEEVIVRWQE
ncbi:MAG: XisH family protein [Desulfobacterales bacterium]|nr:XisH family protein [Desulfobacterales bacterium]